MENWDELEINSNILRGIYAYGFEKPSPIQAKAIQPIIDGKDIIAQAQSGTGKTAAFTIGALTKVDVTLNKTQVLILSPTRELSMQTASVVSGIGNMIDGLVVATMFGGAAFSYHVRTPHIICQMR